MWEAIVQCHFADYMKAAARRAMAAESPDLTSTQSMLPTHHVCCAARIELLHTLSSTEQLTKQHKVLCSNWQLMARGIGEGAAGCAIACAKAGQQYRVLSGAVALVYRR